MHLPFAWAMHSWGMTLTLPAWKLHWKVRCCLALDPALTYSLLMLVQNSLRSHALAFRMANALVGNDADAAGLEIALEGTLGWMRSFC